MKDIQFSTRMSSRDRETIKALAAQIGLSMSDYVTACSLGEQAVIDGLKEALSERRAFASIMPERFLLLIW